MKIWVKILVLAAIPFAAVLMSKAVMWFSVALGLHEVQAGVFSIVAPVVLAIATGVTVATHD